MIIEERNSNFKMLKVVEEAVEEATIEGGEAVVEATIEVVEVEVAGAVNLIEMIKKQERHLKPLEIKPILPLRSSFL